MAKRERKREKKNRERKAEKKREKKLQRREEEKEKMVKSHVECSSELVWQCVKKNNAYVRASVNRTRLSAEKGNVTAKHGFSSSGACLCIFFYFLLFLWEFFVFVAL